jgi:hypothetical protein
MVRDMRRLFVVLVAAAVLAGGAAAAPPHPRLLGIAHGAITAANSQYIDTAPAGPSVGDLRTYWFPITDLSGKPSATRREPSTVATGVLPPGWSSAPRTSSS